MEIKNYLAALTAEQRDSLAEKLGTTRGHLQNVGYGYRPCSPELATALEKHTDGAVSREECRPDDYWLIWPDLAAPTEKVA